MYVCAHVGVHRHIGTHAYVFFWGLTLCLICLFCVWCVFNCVCMWHVEARGRWPMFCFILRIICLRQDFSLNLELFCPASPCSPAVFMSSSPLLTLDWVYGSQAWPMLECCDSETRFSCLCSNHFSSRASPQHFHFTLRDRDCCWAES